jgi:hypothetical protein
MAIDPNVIPVAEVLPEKSLIDGGEVEAGKSVAQTPEEIAAAKQVQETEEKRILEADPATLNDTDKTKRVDLEKGREEKRLLDTPKEQLSAEDQVKQAELIKAKEATDKAKKGAPEAYTDFKFPEGVEVNQPMLEDFKSTAKKHNLTQEAAQELIDLQAKHMQGVSEKLQKDFNEIIATWRKEAVQELGPDYKKEVVYAGRAIDKFGTPELRQLLNQTGVGNHKELVRFFVKVGKTISEDEFVDGKQKTGQKSDAQLFYGDTMK